MRQLVLYMIDGYQRFVSPHKGFACAYRVHCSGQSCSSLGFRAVRRFGVRRGLAILHRRTYKCGVALRRFGPVETRRPTVYQRGDCDLGCGGFGDCDIPGGKGAGKLCEFVSCCDCGSFERRQENKDKRSEDAVYLPAKVGKGQTRDDGPNQTQ